MSGTWQYSRVPLKFALSDKTLFTVRTWLQVREIGIREEIEPEPEPVPPTDKLLPGSQGFLLRSLPVASEQPPLRWLSDYVCYVASQYPRYYIDLRQSFEDYKQKFSSKTRSTINRKIRKYAKHCGDGVSWKVYRYPEDMGEFYERARKVSANTYQEQLLDAGLPESQEFLRNLKKLAHQDRVRGYILYDGDKPVSYLYCPVQDKVLLYQYLGYDPGYAKLSVGTVLQWCALENIFEEKRFRLFDFTEGHSSHKKLFSTHGRLCANVYFMRRTSRNLLLVRSHHAMNTLSKRAGDALDHFGLKSKIKKLIRFGH